MSATSSLHQGTATPLAFPAVCGDLPGLRRLHRCAGPRGRWWSVSFGALPDADRRGPAALVWVAWLGASGGGRSRARAPGVTVSQTLSCFRGGLLPNKPLQPQSGAHVCGRLVESGGPLAAERRGVMQQKISTLY